MVGASDGRKAWQMADILYVAIALGFFGVCLAMAGLYERLLRPAERAPEQPAERV
jgi:hypothetical protein